MLPRWVSSEREQRFVIFLPTPENDDKEYSVSIGVHLDILEDPEPTGC